MSQIIDSDRARRWASTMEGHVGHPEIRLAHAGGGVAVGPISHLTRQEREGQEDAFLAMLKPDRLALRGTVDRAVFAHRLATARDKRHEGEEFEADERVPMAQAWVHGSSFAMRTEDSAE